jgi:hypothetical protein
VDLGGAWNENTFACAALAKRAGEGSCLGGIPSLTMVALLKIGHSVPGASRLDPPVFNTSTSCSEHDSILLARRHERHPDPFSSFYTSRKHEVVHGGIPIVWFRPYSKCLIAPPLHPSRHKPTLRPQPHPKPHKHTRHRQQQHRHNPQNTRRRPNSQLLIHRHSRHR